MNRWKILPFHYVVIYEEFKQKTWRNIVLKFSNKDQPWIIGAIKEKDTQGLANLLIFSLPSFSHDEEPLVPQ